MSVKYSVFAQHFLWKSLFFTILTCFYWTLRSWNDIISFPPFVPTCCSNPPLSTPEDVPTSLEDSSESGPLLPLLWCFENQEADEDGMLRQPHPPSSPSFCCCLATRHHSSRACDWSALFLSWLTHNPLHEEKANRHSLPSSEPQNTPSNGLYKKRVKVKRWPCVLGWNQPVAEEHEAQLGLRLLRTCCGLIMWLGCES